MLFMQDLHRQKEWQIKMNNIYIEKFKYEDIDNALKLEESHKIKILSKRILESEINEDGHYYIVAKEKETNTIVGYAGISFVLDIADLLSIVVDKNNTRRGIASLMLENIIDYCQKNGIKEIILEVRESNTSAQSLYSKYDFKQISTRKNYYDNIENAIIMKREL